MEEKRHGGEISRGEIKKGEIKKGEIKKERCKKPGPDLVKIQPLIARCHVQPLKIFHNEETVINQADDRACF